MAWHIRGGRILSGTEAEKENKEWAEAWASIILGCLAWGVSYYILGGFDTPFKRIAVVTAVAVALFVGWKFSDWFRGALQEFFAPHQAACPTGCRECWDLFERRCRRAVFLRPPLCREPAKHYR